MSTLTLAALPRDGDGGEDLCVMLKHPGTFLQV